MAIEDVITISNWQQGLAESSASGFADMRNVDITSKPGYLLCAEKMYNIADLQKSTTFTANAGTDQLTLATSFARTDGTTKYRAVTFTTTGTLPAGLSLNTVYWIRTVTSGTVFTVSATLLGGNVDITDSGSGVHTIVSYDMIFPKYATVYLYSGANAYLIQDDRANVWTINPNLFGSTFMAPILLAPGDATLTNIGTSTQSQGQGVTSYRGYIFFWRTSADASVSDICYIDTAFAITYAWKTGLSLTGSHLYGSNPIYGKDDTVYFSNGANVGSIVEKVGQTFDPSNSATYTYNNLALDLPALESITAICELGTSLMMGTITGRIFPWDRISSSFNTPLETGAGMINCMKDYQNLLYFSGGSYGRLYTTNGITVQEFLKLPDEMLDAPYNNTYITAITKINNALLLLVHQDQKSPTSVYSGGVYRCDIQTKAITLVAKPSGGYGVSSTSNFFAHRCLAGIDGDIVLNQSAPLQGNLVLNVQNNFIFGYDYAQFHDYTNTSQGYLDFKTLTGQRIDGYNAYIISALYPVGSFQVPRTFQTMQILLNKPLTTGQGVRVSTRKNRTDSFSNAVTFDTSSDLGISNVASSGDINLEATQFIQTKIELTANTTAIGTINFDSPEVQSITFQ